MTWEIQIYEAPSGRAVVQDFICKLQPITQAKLLRQLDLLEEFGVALSMPHAKPLGDSLYELRIRGKQEVRVFYIFVKVNRIYLLHAFQKKTQTTPENELRIARKRQYEIDKL